MTLRIRGGIFHYTFQFNGKRYEKTTNLAATKQNAIEARDKEAEHRKALREGRDQSQKKILVREFSDGAKDFCAGRKQRSTARTQTPIAASPRASQVRKNFSAATR